MVPAAERGEEEENIPVPNSERGCARPGAKRGDHLFIWERSRRGNLTFFGPSRLLTWSPAAPGLLPAPPRQTDWKSSAERNGIHLPRRTIDTMSQIQHDSGRPREDPTAKAAACRSVTVKRATTWENLACGLTRPKRLLAWEEEECHPRGCRPGHGCLPRCGNNLRREIKLSICKPCHDSTRAPDPDGPGRKQATMRSVRREGRNCLGGVEAARPRGKYVKSARLSDITFSRKPPPSSLRRLRCYFRLGENRGWHVISLLPPAGFPGYWRVLARGGCVTNATPNPRSSRLEGIQTQDAPLRARCGTVEGWDAMGRCGPAVSAPGSGHRARQGALTAWCVPYPVRGTSEIERSSQD